MTLSIELQSRRRRSRRGAVASASAARPPHARPRRRSGWNPLAMSASRRRWSSEMGGDEGMRNDAHLGCERRNADLDDDLRGKSRICTLRVELLRGETLPAIHDFKVFYVAEERSFAPRSDPAFRVIVLQDPRSVVAIARPSNGASTQGVRSRHRLLSQLDDPLFPRREARRFEHVHHRHPFSVVTGGAAPSRRACATPA